jgi:hypothetical protein
MTAISRSRNSQKGFRSAGLRNAKRSEGGTAESGRSGECTDGSQLVKSPLKWGARYYAFNDLGKNHSVTEYS